MMQMRDATAVLYNVEIKSLTARTNSPFCSALRANLTITQSKLYSLMSEEQGLIKMTDSTITFKQTTIQRFNITFVYLTRSSFHIEDCYVLDGGLKLMDPLTKTKVTTGFLEARHSSGVVRNSHFIGVSGTNGGCFALFSTSVNIALSTFESCYASQGGGVVYSDTTFLTITNSTFKGNQATHGGSIYFACGNEKQCHCVVTLVSFTSGMAVNGGVVKWTKIRPQMLNITDQGNKAEYGDFEASLPTHTVLLNSDNQTMKGVPGVVVVQPILIAFLDSIGQVVKTDDQSSAELFSDNLVGTTYVISLNGVANFSGVIVQTQPGTSISIQVFSQSISNTFPGSKDAHSLFIYDTRKCVPGEVTSQAGCYLCPSQSFSVDPTEEECRPCPSSATCPGGLLLHLDADYWRSSELSSDVSLCPIQSACLGGQSSTCAEGFSDKLCSKCAEGYYLVGLSSCLECESLPIEAVRSALIIAFLILLCILILWKIPSHSANFKSVHILASFKLILDYLQSLLILSVIHVDWRSALTRLFSSIEMLVSLGLSTFPVECYWSKEYLDDSDVNAVYLKAALAVGFPIALLCLNWVFVLLFHYLSLYRRAICRGWQTSFLLLSILTPYVAKTCLQLVGCRQIEGDSYWLSADVSIECWTAPHYKYVLALFLPACLIYVIGVPMLFAVLLAKFQTSPYRILLIYATSGYTERYHYWEVLSLTRKLLLLLLLTFLARPIWLVQNLACTALLYLYLQLHFHISPCLDGFHKNIETCSFITQLILIAVSFYLQADLKLNANVQIGLCVSIFALLILFLSLSILRILKATTWTSRIQVEGNTRYQEEFSQSDMQTPPPSMVSFEISQAHESQSQVVWPLELKTQQD